MACDINKMMCSALELHARKFALLLICMFCAGLVMCILLIFATPAVYIIDTINDHISDLRTWMIKD